MIVDQRGGDCISQTFRGKLFSELKLVTDNLLLIYYFVTCIVHMYGICNMQLCSAC